ncbi:hypothetical protein NDU88_003503 [Pleurodeles waltl]|uniref:Uncharacterized protein n=1 Tax=Pleurodeles waltl TaxID=8319 RepID=A0AAV7N0B7_PLEWA|nr:hypothetical protein NDU88_003503 [Pleurodeles waltl]
MKNMKRANIPGALDGVSDSRAVLWSPPRCYIHAEQTVYVEIASPVAPPTLLCAEPLVYYSASGATSESEERAAVLEGVSAGSRATSTDAEAQASVPLHHRPPSPSPARAQPRQTLGRRGSGAHIRHKLNATQVWALVRANFGKSAPAANPRTPPKSDQEYKQTHSNNLTEAKEPRSIRSAHPFRHHTCKPYLTSGVTLACGDTVT